MVVKNNNLNIMAEENELAKYALLLNHCFKDIEQFLIRLLSMGESLKESESYNCIQHTSPNESLLLQLKYEFRDILAKHKLAFNYIAKMQNHFQDLRESTHYLFQSLETIISVCNNIYGNQQLPKDVIYPLMETETILYLKSCLSTRESKFWNSLGLHWIERKENFKEYKEHFKPIFCDGWSPDWLSYNETVASTPQPRNSKQLPQDNQIVWLTNLQSQNVKIAEVLYNKTANNNRELDVRRGEYLEVIHHVQNWWKCRNVLGRVGYVPYTILSPYNFEYTSYRLEKNMELLCPTVIEQDEKTNRQSVTRNNSMARSISMPNVPVPPPMPHNTTTPIGFMEYTINTSVEKVRKVDAMDTVQLNSSMHDELKVTLQQREKRKDLEFLVTPDIFISQNSNPKQVAEWLKTKAFSETIINKLKGLNGQELFALPPHVLESYFGRKESRRLISQILLQKNICEYKTLRSAELSAKLAKARQKVDDNDDSNECCNHL